MLQCLSQRSPSSVLCPTAVSHDCVPLNCVPPDSLGCLMPVFLDFPTPAPDQTIKQTFSAFPHIYPVLTSPVGRSLTIEPEMSVSFSPLIYNLGLSILLVLRLQHFWLQSLDTSYLSASLQPEKPWIDPVQFHIRYISWTKVTLALFPFSEDNEWIGPIWVRLDPQTILRKLGLAFIYIHVPRFVESRINPHVKSQIPKTTSLYFR